ncbi:MAG: hypothetical protein QM589_10505 [Thermomicrobiales bacterium]
MSSRDGSGSSGNKRRPANAEPPFGSSTSQGAYDIDPAEIDRYLSGQPQRTSQRQPRANAPRTRTTDQLDRLRQMVEPDTPVSPTTRRTAPVSYRETTPAPRSGSSSRRAVSTPASYDDIYREDDYVRDVAPDDYIEDYPGQWDEEGDPAIAGQSGRRARSMPSMPSVPRVTIPRAITGAAILSDRTALAFIGLGIISLIGMAVLVSNRMTALPPQIGTHVSASGLLEDFAARDVIWRIPLLALMLTLMNLVIGVFAARFDRFASRLVLAAALVVHVLAWVALLRIL